MAKSIYSFSARRLNGHLQSLSEFKGKVLFIVNTASECGFTPQLNDLEALNKEFGPKGFEILAFPSNDFGQQEPLEGARIQEFCQVNYGVTFPVFDKIHLKGPETHPLFQFITDKKGFLSVPRWNFYKYLINKEGEVVDFYFPFTKPSSNKIRKRIKQLLGKS
jgi:glutathione peroxidase